MACLGWLSSPDGRGELHLAKDSGAWGFRFMGSSTGQTTIPKDAEDWDDHTGEEYWTEDPGAQNCRLTPSPIFWARSTFPIQ